MQENVAWRLARSAWQRVEWLQAVKLKAAEVQNVPRVHDVHGAASQDVRCVSDMQGPCSALRDVEALIRVMLGLANCTVFN